MSFNWSDYLILAKNLAGKTLLPCQEAQFRSAISRAYYAAFCSARNLIIQKGDTISSNSKAHKEVQSFFEKRKDIISKEIQSDLDRLRKDRNDADYKDKFPGKLNEKTTFDLYFAQRVVNDLAKI